MDTPDLRGEDPTSLMTLSEVLNHLEKCYGSDVSRSAKTECIKQWFSERAYNVCFPMQSFFRLHSYMLAVKKGDEKTAADLKERLSERLPSTESIERVDLKELEERVAELEELGTSMIMIKYIDGKNHLWSAPWHIECRSPVCIYVEGRWQVVSAMPRGPEVAGDSEHGVEETQDLNVKGDLTRFAPHYQIITQAMNGDAEAPQHITRLMCSSKRDGMCFRVMVVKETEGCMGGVYGFLTRCVKHLQEDDALKLWVEKGQEHGLGLVIPMSNGTAFLTHVGIQYWLFCAIALSSGVTHSRLCEMEAGSCAPVDVLKENGALDDFMRRLGTVYLSGDVEMHTWEAIGGPGRKCAFDPFPHRELATGYEEAECGIAYLGFSRTSPEGSLEWIPHFGIPSHTFPEPSFWEFETTQQVSLALSDLSKVFAEEITWKEYFEMYPRANSRLDLATLPDSEGFVSYFLLDGFGKKQWTYCKAKTWMYYLLHKVKSKDIPDILRIIKRSPKFVTIFPDCQAIQLLFGDECAAKMERMFAEMAVAIPSLSDKIPPTDRAYKALQTAKETGNMRPVYGIVLNNAATQRPFIRQSVGIASSHFGCFDGLDVETEGTQKQPTAAEDAARIFKRCLLSLRVSEDGWRTRLSEQMKADKLLHVRSMNQMPEVPRLMWDFISTASYKDTVQSNFRRETSPEISRRAV
uniref:Uncharacterized protein n=1 Tax=Chromera velia CCMP2878 TaxID=1169474 RepID=A0A0G4G8X7_9ALVE|eukprot:Cvel_598.t1-p1 / transcript=Cvel_598.t1 / gene=Cvel_598 / organism=Chromera_velia_CCMP2878 / gene_product=hypothetical protein / transcript_product=hypothetical protein / location=Cvel_scaffold18:144979-147051(-) / protein_length=691 / sequence_SO=supercontig / SO=protein_coding / is_pseudo=false